MSIFTIHVDYECMYINMSPISLCLLTHPDASVSPTFSTPEVASAQQQRNSLTNDWDDGSNHRLFTPIPFPSCMHIYID